jgi:hypothetical protein
LRNDRITKAEGPAMGRGRPGIIQRFRDEVNEDLGQKEGDVGSETT